jgi:hypothetical protein
VILEVNRVDVGDVDQAVAARRSVSGRDAVFLLLWRQGRELFVTMPLE